MRHPANTRAFTRRRFLVIVGAWKGFFWRVLRLCNLRSYPPSYIQTWVLSFQKTTTTKKTKQKTPDRRLEVVEQVGPLQIFFILLDALCWPITWYSVKVFLCWSWWWWYHWPAHLDIWPCLQVLDCFSSLAFNISCLLFAKEALCFQFVRHDRVHCLAVSYQEELELKVLLRNWVSDTCYVCWKVNIPPFYCFMLCLIHVLPERPFNCE